MDEKKSKKSVKKKELKTWLDLSEDDLKKITSNTACMYGKKGPHTCF